MCFRIKRLLGRLDAWNIKHIDRRFNEKAQAVAQDMITEVFIMKADAPMYMGSGIA